MSWEPIKWQDVKGLPEGARVQNNKQAKVTSVFFPYYFWDPKTKGPKQERDYIGSVKNGEFVPNAFYLQHSPVASVRDPARWRNPIQREIAFAEQKEMEALRKQEEKEASEEVRPQEAPWINLELPPEEDVVRKIGASGILIQMLYESGLIADVARVLDFDLEQTMFVVNHAVLQVLTSQCRTGTESESVKLIGRGCCGERAGECFSAMGRRLQLSQRLSKLRLQRLASCCEPASAEGDILDCTFSGVVPQKPGAQLNFALLTDAAGHPVGYCGHRSGVHDMTTLDDLVEMWLEAGFKKAKVELVWDRGDVDVERIQRLGREGLHCISGAHVAQKAISEAIDTCGAEFHSARSLLDRHSCHGKKVPVQGAKDDGKPKAVGYVYFSPAKYMTEIRSLRKEIAQAKQKWRDGKIDKEADIPDLFEKPQEGKEPVLNAARFERECRRRGFFACISNADRSLDEILDKYRLRNEVEGNFRLMLGDLHRTTGVKSSESLDGMLLVTFVALSLLADLRATLSTKLPAQEIADNCAIMDFDGEHALDGSRIVPEVLRELNSVVAVRSHCLEETRLIDLTAKQVELMSELRCEGLFKDADELWKLMSAERLASHIAALKAQDEREADGDAPRQVS